MKILSYRTTMPFDGGLSPETPKSIMPFNNVFTIQDVLDGRRYVLPGGGGEWSAGKGAKGEDVEKNYREEGDAYKRMERDWDILKKMSPQQSLSTEIWKLKVPGGFKTFPSFNAAQKYKEELSEKGIRSFYLARIAQNQQPETNDVIESSLNKCFMVESMNLSKGVKEAGAAFCVFPNHFVTCAHVIKSYNKQNLKADMNYENCLIYLVKQESRYESEIIAVDFKLDIAIIRANVKTDSFQLDKDMVVGDNIIAIGSPHGYENNVSKGILGSQNRKIYFYEGAPSYMFVDVAINPGNSGGPVIKESNGKVVGMVTLIISGEKNIGAGLNAALPVNYIEDFCNAHIQGFQKQ